MVEIGAHLQHGVIVADLAREDIRHRAMDRGEIVILKQAFDPDLLTAVRTATFAWGQVIPAGDVDDFSGNYHRRRAMISRLQQAPHIFHDYNFNALGAAPAALQGLLLRLFEPLRGLFRDLTGIETSFVAPATGAYVHPQLIQYPNGGGFFGRHWHNLHPQQLGFIVSLSKRGLDYRNGGTCFEIDGDVLDLGDRQDIGDITVWRYDHQHWVTQSDLKEKFDWDRADGRWVATYAYFDPFA
ncbi:MAG: hypothetical protein ACREEW_09435 [Caulobacteraceae bacterium]